MIENEAKYLQAHDILLSPTVLKTTLFGNNVKVTPTGLFEQFHSLSLASLSTPIITILVYLSLGQLRPSYFASDRNIEII